MHDDYDDDYYYDEDYEEYKWSLKQMEDGCAIPGKTTNSTRNASKTVFWIGIIVM